MKRALRDPTVTGFAGCENRTPCVDPPVKTGRPMRREWTLSATTDPDARRKLFFLGLVFVESLRLLLVKLPPFIGNSFFKIGNLLKQFRVSLRCLLRRVLVRNGNEQLQELIGLFDPLLVLREQFLIAYVVRWARARVRTRCRRATKELPKWVVPCLVLHQLFLEGWIEVCVSGHTEPQTDPNQPALPQIAGTACRRQASLFPIANTSGTTSAKHMNATAVM